MKKLLLFCFSVMLYGSHAHSYDGSNGDEGYIYSSGDDVDQSYSYSVSRGHAYGYDIDYPYGYGDAYVYDTDHPYGYSVSRGHVYGYSGKSGRACNCRRYGYNPSDSYTGYHD